MLLVVTFLASLLTCGLIIHSRDWHLRFSGDHDLDGPQKFHVCITPRIGGLAIFLGAQIGLGFLVWTQDASAGPCFYVLLASLPVFVAGLNEDLTKTLRIKWRLLSAFVSGGIFVALFEIEVIRLDIIYLDALFEHPWIAFIFLIFAIGGLCNAYNIIDGFNGLASMLGIISLAAILYVGLQVNDVLVITLNLLAIAAIGGFFLWNYPRGLIFLGDCGAYLIGFLIASTSILLVVRNENVSPWFVLLVNAYPIFETIFTIWRRTIHQGKSAGVADGMHFHSLIYRRMIRRAYYYDSAPNYYLGNSKTSVYIWIFSSLGTIPALLWWDSSTVLILSLLGFILSYVYIYLKVVRFQTPVWMKNRLIKESR